MGDFIKLSSDNIIKESETTIPKYCNKKYIIYKDPHRSKQKIRINTEYNMEGDVVRLCRYYDRALCDEIEELQKLSLDYIESQAYNSWMDGAR